MGRSLGYWPVYTEAAWGSGSFSGLRGCDLIRQECEWRTCWLVRGMCQVGFGLAVEADVRGRHGEEGPAVP